MIKLIFTLFALSFMGSAFSYPGKCDLSISPEANARSADADENTYQTCVDMLGRYKTSLRKLVKKYTNGIYSVRGSIVLEAPELKEIGIKTNFPYAAYWELNQITDEWIVYTNDVLLELPGRYNFLIAIKRDSIKNLKHITLRKNERLFTRFQYLGKLEKKKVPNQMGFDIPVIFYEAVYPTPL